MENLDDDLTVAYMLGFHDGKKQAAANWNCESLADSARDMPKADPFYLGVEWLACWMLDNVEGEIVSDEKLQEWAGRAWARHILSQNSN